MAKRATTHTLPGVSAAARVLDDVELLSRILWAPSASGGNGYTLCIRELCAAACVRRAWRQAFRDAPAWLPLLRAALSKALPPGDADAHRGRGDSGYRAFAQLHRLGVASLPACWCLQGYTLLMDVSDAQGATVACAAIQLGDLNLSCAAKSCVLLKVPVAPLPDGGAAAARFLARVSDGDTDLRELRLQLLLRLPDGAVALLARGQRARRFGDDDLDVHYGDPMIEHEVWQANEHKSCRHGAATWHSSHAPRAARRLFGTPVTVGPDREQPAWWTWRLQFPANRGAVPQLSRITLRFAMRARLEATQHDFGNVPFRARDLAAILERRSAAEAESAWVPR